VVNLYSYEYFRLLRERLAPGGVVTYWLPVDQLLVKDARAVLRGFCDAFPDCSLWGGAALNWMLVGTRDLTTAAPAEAFSGAWRDARVGPEMAALGLELPEQLGALFLGDAPFLRELAGDTPPLVDDFPLRIAHPLAGVDWQASQFPVFRGWMDPDGARRRFQSSLFVARVWPEELRPATLPFFRYQGQIDDGMIRNAWWRPPAMDALPELHEALTRTSLRTLPLWWLGTTVDEQEIVRALAERGAGGFEGLRGLGALADRAYEQAATLLARAQAADPGDLADAYREVYALCLAGRFEEAQARAELLKARADRPRDAAFWAWLEAATGREAARQLR
jgi:hypothetical protein